MTQLLQRRATPILAATTLCLALFAGCASNSQRSDCEEVAAHVSAVLATEVGEAPEERRLLNTHCDSAELSPELLDCYRAARTSTAIAGCAAVSHGPIVHEN